MQQVTCVVSHFAKCDRAEIGRRVERAFALEQRSEFFNGLLRVQFAFLPENGFPSIARSSPSARLGMTARDDANAHREAARESI
jgi:hypothetical protein